MDYHSPLQELGLKPAEAQIYVGLLKTGPTSIRSLAAATKINRGTTYESLKSLTELGLVAHVRKGQRLHYRAESPERIHDLIEDRRRHLEQLTAQSKQLIPSLLALGHRRLGEPTVRFYEDDEGIVVILRDVLGTTSQLKSKQYYAYSSRPLRKYLYRHFPQFTTRRVQAGVGVKVIAIGEGGEPSEQAERRWLPEPPASELSSYVLIYGPKSRSWAARLSMSSMSSKSRVRKGSVGDLGIV